MGSVQCWGKSPPGIVGATFLQGRKSGNVFVPWGSTQTFSSHLLYLHSCRVNPSSLNSSVAHHGLGQKPKGLCQTLSCALDHRSYLHWEVLFGSAVITEQINGRKRSGKKLSLGQLHPSEQPLAHVWRLHEKCAGNGRAAARLQPAAIPTSPGMSEGMGFVWILFFWGVAYS